MSRQAFPPQVIIRAAPSCFPVLGHDPPSPLLSVTNQGDLGSVAYMSPRTPGAGLDSTIKDTVGASSYVG